MSANLSREHQDTGHGNLGDIHRHLRARNPRWQTRRYVQQALIPGQEASIAVKVLSDNSILGQLDFEPCTAVFTHRLPVLAVAKETVVNEDLGLTPISFKTPYPEVDTPWGTLKPTHYVQLMVKKELYGIPTIMLEHVLVVPDDFPHPRGDIFFGTPFMERYCGGKLPVKVPRQAVPRHATRHDWADDIEQKNTGKRSAQSKRQRSPQQAAEESYKQGNIRRRQSSNKKARISQLRTQTQTPAWYNPNLGIIGQPSQLHGSARSLRRPSASLSVPLENQSHPLLAAQIQYAPSTPVPTSYRTRPIPTASPPMRAPYVPPRQAPGRLEPDHTPVQAQPHPALYIPRAGGVQPDDPGHFEDHYVHASAQAFYSASTSHNTAEAAAPQLENPAEQYGTSDSYDYNYYNWNHSEFDPTGGGQGQY